MRWIIAATLGLAVAGLVKAQEAQIKSLELYVLGYRDWFRNMPKTFDVTLRLTALTPEALKAAQGGPQKKQPPKRKTPLTRGKLGGCAA